MVHLLYAEDEGEVFLGRSVTQTKHMSDDTAKLIDDEVRQIIDRNYDRAKKILEDNMDIMHAMKDALMKYETIDARQIDDLMERKAEIREPAGWGDNPMNKPKDDDKPQATPEVKEEEKATDSANAAEQVTSQDSASSEVPEKKDSE